MNLHCCGCAVTYFRHEFWRSPFPHFPSLSGAQQWYLNLFHSLYSNYNHQAYKPAHCVQNYAYPLPTSCIVQFVKQIHVTNKKNPQ